VSNFTLYNGVDTHDLTVLDATGLHGFHTRGDLETSPNEVTWLRGDDTDVVQPITCALLINAATEAAAVTEFRSIIAFAKNAEYIRRTDQSSWRALHGSGLSLLAFDPNVAEGAGADTWVASLTMMPLYALWTVEQIRTLADYQAAATAGEVWTYLSPGLWIQADTIEVHP
jgi:ABC-type uncharacterized transport system YnjBCD permease subunit